MGGQECAKCPRCGTIEDVGIAVNSPREWLWVYCSRCDLHAPGVVDPDTFRDEGATEKEEDAAFRSATANWNEFAAKYALVDGGASCATGKGGDALPTE